jgi:hypothetical protein
VATAGESGQKGTTIAEDGAEATTIAEDGAEAKKADKEEAASFFFLVNALRAGGRKQG